MISGGTVAVDCINGRQSKNALGRLGVCFAANSDDQDRVFARSGTHDGSAAPT